MEKNKIYHFLYKTTCIITKKYYIGVHSTPNLEDGYLGSGKLLKESVEQYGKNNHVREIINFFNSSKEKFLAEKEYITHNMLLDSNCMNMCYGGDGGIKHEEHGKKFAINGSKSFVNKLKNNPEFAKYYSNKIRENVINQPRGFIKKRLNGEILPNHWIGRKHKPETIEKQKQTYKKSGHAQGEKNSQYGSMWITDGINNKKIKKEDQIPIGWSKGRKINIQ